MKVLLDQGLPRSTAVLLRNDGMDVIHVAEAGMATASDLEILQKAHDDGRVIITLDADFHALFAGGSRRSPSVVRIRVEGLIADQMASLLRNVFARFGREIEAGVLMSVERTRVRVRHLPLGK